MKRQTYIHTY